MTYFTRAAAAAGVLLAATGLLAAGPAQAAPRSHGNRLHLTITRSGDRAGGDHSALLRCLPPHGHPYAAEACAELSAARGDIDRIPARKVFCPRIYSPVTATARGRWNGRAVDFRRTYTNSCELRARTGSVFDLGD
ncbi:SSI family serine proteinase inhibitor [Streptomyces malaysiense]|uniref:Serine protease n=1 Tax=Streptomyces malaysiense TaxID=1428626 RepID=A0A1J4Q575_9ACTN|nr:SSI family serine proteinase inhibitor [Streptomyces malaysiense]OIK27526.1 serine protease [Streptomyces malaysiense]